MRALASPDLADVELVELVRRAVIGADRIGNPRRELRERAETRIGGTAISVRLALFFGGRCRADADGTSGGPCQQVTARQFRWIKIGVDAADLVRSQHDDRVWIVLPDALDLVHAVVQGEVARALFFRPRTASLLPLFVVPLFRPV